MSGRRVAPREPDAARPVGMPAPGSRRAALRAERAAETVEPAAERVLEPVAEPVLEPVAERVLEPVAEPVLEPVAEPVPEPAAAEASRRPRRGGRRFSPGLLLVSLQLASIAYLSSIGGLLWWSHAPMLVGWQPKVVLTGSMLPVIRPGDVALVGPADPRDPLALPPGRIILVRDPSRESGSYLHRVIRYEDNGFIVTKGDANPTEDHPSVDPARVRGQVRLLVPAIGRPVVWLHDHRYPMLGGSLALTWLAIAVALAARGRKDDDEDEADDVPAVTPTDAAQPPTVDRGPEDAPAAPRLEPGTVPLPRREPSAAPSRPAPARPALPPQAARILSHRTLGAPSPAPAPDAATGAERPVTDLDAVTDLPAAGDLDPLTAPTWPDAGPRDTDPAPDRAVQDEAVQDQAVQDEAARDRWEQDGPVHDDPARDGAGTPRPSGPGPDAPTAADVVRDRTAALGRPSVEEMLSAMSARPPAGDVVLPDAGVLPSLELAGPAEPAGAPVPADPAGPSSPAAAPAPSGPPLSAEAERLVLDLDAFEAAFGAAFGADDDEDVSGFDGRGFE